MTKIQVLEAIRQMPNVERLEIIEFASRLVREDMNDPKAFNLATAAEIMGSFYAEDPELTEFVDTDNV